jgi:hypothetical protein
MVAPPINTASKMTLLQMVQEACAELGITQPSTVIGNPDQQVIQILALANREGRDFSQRAHRIGGWQQMRQEYLFNTEGITDFSGDLTEGATTIVNMTSTVGLEVGWIISGNGIPTETSIVSIDSATQVTMSQASQATDTDVSLSAGQQNYPLPDDFGWCMTQTFWDRAFRWQLLGPLDAQEWQVLKSGISPTGPRRRFRIMGNYFYIDPVPSEVDQEVFEYYSNAWCQSAAGIPQTSWQADSDYYTLDDECMVLGIMWRYLAAKRLSYDEEKRTYELAVQRAMSRNGANRNLPLNASASGIRLLNEQNVPDTGYGS